MGNKKIRYSGPKGQRFPNEILLNIVQCFAATCVNDHDVPMLQTLRLVSPAIKAFSTAYLFERIKIPRWRENAIPRLKELASASGYLANLKHLIIPTESMLPHGIEITSEITVDEEVELVDTMEEVMDAFIAACPRSIRKLTIGRQDGWIQLPVNSLGPERALYGLLKHSFNSLGNVTVGRLDVCCSRPGALLGLLQFCFMKSVRDIHLIVFRHSRTPLTRNLAREETPLISRELLSLLSDLSNIAEGVRGMAIDSTKIVFLLFEPDAVSTAFWTQLRYLAFTGENIFTTETLIQLFSQTPDLQTLVLSGTAICKGETNSLHGWYHIFQLLSEISTLEMVFMVALSYINDWLVQGHTGTMRGVATGRPLRSYYERDYDALKDLVSTLLLRTKQSKHKRTLERYLRPEMLRPIPQPPG